ncbi:FMN-dependent NADH-azoreductase [Pseudomonas sp. 2835]|uniref:FMN-dependent NADH-azoreductase n=1 Tax=Pseudomonas sp. 2835 TaxID=3156451 RepID=UPI003D206A92
MDNLLLVNASMRGSASIGLRLAGEMVACIRHQYPHLKVTLRDLAATPLAPLSAGYATALTGFVPPHDPVFASSEALISELEICDLLLIATPMHNFTVPAALKLWIDHVLRIHRTFIAGPEGKVGLLKDRPVYLIVSSGGYHRGARARQPDFLSAYLRHVLGTLGLQNVHFVYLEGMAVSDQARLASVTQARLELARHRWFGQLCDSETTSARS